jgi:4-amino-4-deoxy-L-arabinose transferase-like glycosyltransferase
MSTVRSHTRPILLIVALAVPTVFAGLGQATLWETDEPLYVEASRQMVETGEVLTPFFNGEPRFQKPILFYWLSAAFYLVFGVSEWAARLPAALAGVASAIVLYGIGSRLASRAVGLMAAAALLTTFRVAVFSRQAVTDVPVLFFILLALYGLIRTLDGLPEDRRYALLAWAGMALGVITKGPVGLLPLAVWIPFLIVARRGDGFGRLHPAVGIPVFAVVAAPWYAYMVWQHGAAYLEVSLLSEVVDRMSATDFGGPRRGLLYYFSVWPADAVPWTPFFLAAVGLLVARWSAMDRQVRQLGVFACTWFVVIQLIFAFSVGKQPHYIIPSYPAMALLVALMFDQVPKLPGTLPRVALRTSALVLGVMAVGLAALGFLFLTRVMGNPVGSPAMLFPIAAATGGVVIPWLHWRGSTYRAFGATVCLTAVAYGALGRFVVPNDLEQLKPIRPLAEVIAAQHAPGDRVGLLRNVSRSSVISGLSFVYYTRQEVRWLHSAAEAAAFFREPGRAFCLMQDRDYFLLRNTYTQDLYVLGEGGMLLINLRHLFDADPRADERTMLVVSNRPG